VGKVYIYIIYKVRKYYVPRDVVCNILRVILGVNFSVIYIKVEVEYKAIKSIFGI